MEKAGMWYYAVQRLHVNMKCHWQEPERAFFIKVRIGKGERREPKGIITSP